MAGNGGIRVGISPGELLDKISILEIKASRITDPTALSNVRRELSMLEEARDAALPQLAALGSVVRELSAVNQSLWDVEDAIRAEEAAARFGPRFVALARAVYRNNDRRAALKKRINELFGSGLVEEKLYSGSTEPALDAPAQRHAAACAGAGEDLLDPMVRNSR